MATVNYLFTESLAAPPSRLSRGVSVRVFTEVDLTVTPRPSRPASSVRDVLQPSRKYA